MTKSYLLSDGRREAEVADAVVSRRVVDDGTVVIDLRGELDVAVNDALRGVLIDTVNQRPPRVVVNMRHVVFIDSTGMGALVAGYGAARDAGVEYEVRDMAPFVEKQLRATGLYDLLVRPAGRNQ
jgi:anti-sigma B factor antagonist